MEYKGKTIWEKKNHRSLYIPPSNTLTIQAIYSMLLEMKRTGTTMHICKFSIKKSTDGQIFITYRGYDCSNLNFRARNRYALNGEQESISNKLTLNSLILMKLFKLIDLEI